MTAGARSLLGAVLLLGAFVPGARAQPADLAECVKAARTAGVPQDVANAMYLMEWRNPTYFAGYPCAAAKSGAKFKYISGGMFRSEAFEMVGEKRLRVTVTRSRIEGSNELLLIPATYELDGIRYEVTRANIQLLAHLLRMAASNDWSPR